LASAGRRPRPSPWRARGERSSPSPARRPPLDDPTSSDEQCVPSTSPAPAASPSSSPSVALVPADVPIVPVAQFRTTVTTVGRDDIRQTLAGTSPTWQGVEVVASEADAVFAGLGVDVPEGAKVILAKDARP
jgi:hypothetical protein